MGGEEETLESALSNVGESVKMDVSALEVGDKLPVESAFGIGCPTSSFVGGADSCNGLPVLDPESSPPEETGMFSSTSLACLSHRSDSLSQEL